MSARDINGLQYDPTTLAKDQARYAVSQRGDGSYVPKADPYLRQADLQALQKEEIEKNQLINMLQGAAGAAAGRGVPAYNQNMANGRQGLVDPALTQQQTFRPMPWDERLASAANLAGVQNSTRLYGPSEQVTSQVSSLTPQMQEAVRPHSTIYVQTPNDWMTNRLNLALQRRRETSVYAIV